MPRRLLRGVRSNGALRSLGRGRSLYVLNYQLPVRRSLGEGGSTLQPTQLLLRVVDRAP